MISVDLDSTLNNLMYEWVRYINDLNRTHFRVIDILEYDDPLLTSHLEFVDRPDLYEYLEPLPGAQTFINSLTNIDSVQIVSVTSKQHIESKQKFIRTHFPGTEFILVSTKLDVVAGTFLIDDKPDTVLQHIENGYDGVIFNNDEYVYATAEGVFSGGYDSILKYLMVR